MPHSQIKQGVDGVTPNPDPVIASQSSDLTRKPLESDQEEGDFSQSIKQS